MTYQITRCHKVSASALPCRQKRKQNTWLISDKQCQVEHRLSCVCFLKKHGHGEERTGLNVCVFG